jgi:hypothetical protein
MMRPVTGCNRLGSGTREIRVPGWIDEELLDEYGVPGAGLVLASDRELLQMTKGVRYAETAFR